MSYNPETGMFEGYIYHVLNKINSKVYIGQTSLTVDERWHKHCITTNTVFDSVIKKYGKENFIISTLIKMSSDSEYELYKLLNYYEVYYIKKFNSLISQNGYNVSIGGGNLSNAKLFDLYDLDGNIIEFNRSAKYYKEKYNVGTANIYNISSGKQPNYKNMYVFRESGDLFDKYKTESHLTKTLYQFDFNGNLVKKYKNPNDVYNKLHYHIPYDIIDNPSRSKYGFWWSFTGIFNYLQEHVDKKGIDVYDKLGNYIASYDSGSEAIIKLNLPNAANVFAVCRGKKISYFGYIFRYKGEHFNKYKTNVELTYNKKPVIQYDKDMNYVATYESIKEASDALKVTSSLISTCCKNYNRTAKGYKWRYYNDEKINV